MYDLTIDLTAIITVLIGATITFFLQRNYNDSKLKAQSQDRFKDNMLGELKEVGNSIKDLSNNLSVVGERVYNIDRRVTKLEDEKDRNK